MLYFIILVLFVLVVTLFIMYHQSHKRVVYLEGLLVKILSSDDIVEESIATVATAYGIEEGDLRDYISKQQQKRKEKK